MGYGGATSVPYRGGNSNNGAHCGAFYVNLNNTASNSNWNIGAAQSYPITEQRLNAPLYPCPLAEMNSKQASASSRSNQRNEAGGSGRKRMRG